MKRTGLNAYLHRFKKGFPAGITLPPGTHQRLDYRGYAKAMQRLMH